MKKLLFTAICLASTMTISAQRARSSSSSFFSTEKTDQPMTLGIRAGMNLSNFCGDYTDELDSRIGFNIGVSLDIPLMQSLYLQTGLYATQKGAKYEDDYEEETYNPLYLEIPVLASYRYNFSDATQLQINFGPYIAYGLSGKMKYEDKYDSEKEEEDFFGDGIKRLDIGLQVGAGVTFNKFFVGCAYEFGLTDISDDGNIKNSNFMINIGYNF